MIVNATARASSASFRPLVPLQAPRPEHRMCAHCATSSWPMPARDRVGKITCFAQKRDGVTGQRLASPPRPRDNPQSWPPEFAVGASPDGVERLAVIRRVGRHRFAAPFSLDCNSFALTPSGLGKHAVRLGSTWALEYRSEFGVP